MMFTGRAVSGRGNSSHLCEGPDCLIAVYTGHKEATATEPRVEHQNLSASEDGMTWRKYERNPVLNRNVPEFRDPKVSWHEWMQLWIMIMLALLEREALRYGSKDLKDWTLPGDSGPAGSRAGVWECPDMFELPVDGMRRTHAGC